MRIEGQNKEEAESRHFETLYSVILDTVPGTWYNKITFQKWKFNIL